MLFYLTVKDEIDIGLFGVDPGGHFTSSTVASAKKWTTLVVEIRAATTEKY
jgi:hypothetical protein